METYLSNRDCPCLRCRMNLSMRPAILITVGTMLLLDNLHVTHGSMFVAVLLIVIGGVKLLQSSASTEGHIQPVFYAPPPFPAGSGSASGVNTNDIPGASPDGGTSGPAGGTSSGNGEVHHG